MILCYAQQISTVSFRLARQVSDVDRVGISGKFLEDQDELSNRIGLCGMPWCLFVWPLGHKQEAVTFLCRPYGLATNCYARRRREESFEEDRLDMSEPYVGYCGIAGLSFSLAACGRRDGQVDEGVRFCRAIADTQS